MEALRKIVLCLVILLVFCLEAGAGEITIVFIERPPFYYTDNLEVKGILADLTNRVFQTAKVPYSWQSLPPNRIISMFQNMDSEICSPGWFFKSDRLAYANFTLAIYQNRPASVLVKKQAKRKFEKYSSLAGLFSDQSMTMGTVATYRYSRYIDEQINQHHPRQIQVYGSASQLITMILINRVDYMITSPAEAESLIHEAGLKPNQFDLLTFPDIPPGSKRYLMCSKSIDETTINALNNAIRQLVDPGVWDE